MRIIASLALAACLLLAGYIAADLRASDDDARAGTTWQYEHFDVYWEMGEFVETLPAECSVDWEPLSDIRTFLIYSCPE